MFNIFLYSIYQFWNLGNFVCLLTKCFVYAFMKEAVGWCVGFGFSLLGWCVGIVFLLWVVALSLDWCVGFVFFSFLLDWCVGFVVSFILEWYGFFAAVL